jgi:hypothetical protein
MSFRLRHLFSLVAVLVAAFALAPGASAADPPISLSEAYRQIKDAERLIPVPTPVRTVSMGTFDASTGQFDGLATEIEIVNHKPVRLVPEVFVNAVNARLQFTILHSTQLVRVSVTGGGTAIASAGGASVTVDAGRLDDVRWTIRSGTKVYRDELIVKRPRIIGAGAFTIPALPVAVVYDPPQNPARNNSVVYTRTTSVGTTLGMTVRSGSSTSSSGVSPTFPEVGIFKSQLDASAAFANATGNSAVGTALSKISGALGKATRNVTTSNDGADSFRRTFTFTESHTCSTDSGVQHAGPGHGDRIAYLRNARLVWYSNGAGVSLQFLGYDSFECPTIDQLRSGVAGLDPSAATPLIALDPFAGALGPKAPLATDPRYVALPSIGLLPGLVQTATYQQQLLIEKGHVETSATVKTDDLGAGLLSLVGLAPSQSQQIVSTLSVTNETSTTDSTTVSTTLTARTLVNGIRTELAVFYDRAFGTVAFQDPRP